MIYNYVDIIHKHKLQLFNTITIKASFNDYKIIKYFY